MLALRAARAAAVVLCGWCGCVVSGRGVPCTVRCETTCGAPYASSFAVLALRGAKNGEVEEPRRELAACKTLASLSLKHCKPHCSSSRSFQASPQQRRLASKVDAALPLATSDALGGCSSALSMPDDDEDEVGTGLYILIGCAAVTVVLMYSWIGYTLYQGFKARRKVD